MCPPLSLTAFPRCLLCTLPWAAALPASSLRPNFCVVLPHSAGSPPPPGSLPRAARRRGTCPHPHLPALSPRGNLSGSAQQASPPRVCACTQHPRSQAQNSPQRRWRVEAGLRSGSLRCTLHPGARPARRAVLPSAFSSRWNLVLPSLSPPACHHQPVTHTGDVIYHRSGSPVQPSGCVLDMLLVPKP